MKNLLALAGILVFSIGVTGCETTKGVGEDMSNTGKNIQQGINSSTTNDTTNTAGNMSNDSGIGAGTTNDTMNSTGY